MIEEIAVKGLGPTISKHQQVVLEIVKEWARTYRTPMPKKELIKRLILKDVSESTSREALRLLVKNGYMRRSVGRQSSGYNTASYVLLRWI